MKFAVVILAYNHNQITKRCVESVRDRLGLSCPIYLVHNGSEHKNIAELKEYFRPGNSHLECEIHHLVLEKNRGFTGGANFGLSSAFSIGSAAQESASDHRADWVLFLSNDTKLRKFSVSEFDVFEKDFFSEPSLLSASVYRRQTSDLESVCGTVDLKTGRLRHDKKWMASSTMRTSMDLANVSASAPPTHLRSYVPGAAFLMSRLAYELIGGFDESLGTYWEDVELSLRAAARGCYLGHYSGLEVSHGIAKTTKGDPLYTVFYFFRNRRRVVLKYCLRSSHRLIFYFVYSKDVLKKFASYLRRRDWVRLHYLFLSLKK